jgi:hypothetical protein
MAGSTITCAPTVTQVAAAAYVVPTDAPEADGTLTRDATTLVMAASSHQPGNPGWA